MTSFSYSGDIMKYSFPTMSQRQLERAYLGLLKRQAIKLLLGLNPGFEWMKLLDHAIEMESFLGLELRLRGDSLVLSSPFPMWFTDSNDYVWTITISSNTDSSTTWTLG